VFSNIPHELRAYRQWVVWRFEAREGAKDTKVPYSVVTRKKASVTEPSDWCSYDEAVACIEAEGGQLNSSMPGLAGIGFVLTEYDPYGFIDLDDTHGDEEAHARQFKVFTEFDTYSEYSPSGQGLHLIIKGQVPHGRKRAGIELYSKERYMTMTGNVLSDKPIADRNQLFNVLFDEMGGPAVNYVFGEDQEQKQTDDEILEMAQRAANGDKFAQLYTGNYHNAYSSQSEADQALMNILAFYTQNRAQLMRLFRGSELGQRDKAQRDRYLDYTINKAFDRQLPPLDLEGLLIAFKNMVAEKPNQSIYVNAEPIVPATILPAGRGADEPGGTSAPLSAASDGGPDVSDYPQEGQPDTSSALASASSQFPPGLVGEIAQFILDQAPRPVPTYALAGAIGLMSGVTGRAYNVSGTGLNHYVMFIGTTGTGKEAPALGISKLMNAIQNSVPAANEFIGPAGLVSEAGLIKWLSRYPAVYSIVGEIGVKLKEMSAFNASGNMIGLRRALLDLFNKSGHGSTLSPTAYSDKEKNALTVHSPSFTLIGESTPEKFYEVLDESMIAEGLLPRFTIMEYEGKRVPLNYGAENIRPDMRLVERFGSLVAQCLSIAHNRGVHNVPITNEAYALFDEFDRWCDKEINSAISEVTRQLWNRGHVKALKLAALVAVGIDYINPRVTIHEARWSTDQVASQINALQDRFMKGDVGQAIGNELSQTNEMKRVLIEYMRSPSDRYAGYGVDPAMHTAGVVPYVYIQRRLVAMAIFRHDKIGGTNAIARAIKLLIETGVIAELPKVQVQSTFGKAERAFAITNVQRINPD
jgi:hypothetical protein